jgi:hypothetical protein
VPGVPGPVRFLVDQRRIILDWDAPQHNPDLANGYIIQRADRPGVISVTTNHFEDADYEPDKKYVYTVTATRGNEQIPGPTGEPASVLAKDEKGPAIPAGLEIQELDPARTRVLLRWRANTERDFKEVLVYRSDRTEEIARRSVDVYIDEAYRPGLSYQLVAVDELGNFSGRSASVAGP